MQEKIAEVCCCLLAAEEKTPAASPSGSAWRDWTFLRLGSSRRYFSRCWWTTILVWAADRGDRRHGLTLVADTNVFMIAFKAVSWGSVCVSTSSTSCNCTYVCFRWRLQCHLHGDLAAAAVGKHPLPLWEERYFRLFLHFHEWAFANNKGIIENMFPEVFIIPSSYRTECVHGCGAKLSVGSLEDAWQRQLFFWGHCSFRSPQLVSVKLS